MNNKAVIEPSPLDTAKLAAALLLPAALIAADKVESGAPWERLLTGKSPATRTSLRRTRSCTIA